MRAARQRRRVRGLGAAASALALVGLVGCGGDEQGKDQHESWDKETTLERACGGIFDAASIRAIHKADPDTESVYEEQELESPHSELVKKLASGDDMQSATLCSVKDAADRFLVKVEVSPAAISFPKGQTTKFSIIGVATPAVSLRIDCGMPNKAPTLAVLLMTGAGRIDFPVRRSVLAHAGEKAAAAVHCPNHFKIPPVPVFVSG